MPLQADDNCQKTSIFQIKDHKNSAVKQDPRLDQPAWTSWKRNIEEVVTSRVSWFADKHLDRSRPLRVTVSYQVTVEKRIVNVEVIRKSDSPLFNKLVVRGVQSMSGDELLKFPSNGEGKDVSCISTFEHFCYFGDFNVP
jgi:hypothetical protein